MGVFRKVSAFLIAPVVALGIAVSARAANAGVIQLGFILDRSGSIGSSNWRTIVNGLSSAINTIVPTDSSYEVSVFSFGSTAAIDGVPNNQNLAVAARNALLSGASVDNLSIEAIGSGVNASFLQNSICFPGPCTIAPTFCLTVSKSRWQTRPNMPRRLQTKFRSLPTRCRNPA